MSQIEKKLTNNQQNCFYVDTLLEYIHTAPFESWLLKRHTPIFKVDEASRKLSWETR